MESLCIRSLQSPSCRVGLLDRRCSIGWRWRERQCRSGSWLCHTARVTDCLCHDAGVTTGVPRIAVDVYRLNVLCPLGCGCPCRSVVDFRKREDLMTERNKSIGIALLASSVFAMASSASAADVTAERLLNPDKEPQNWLMNHRTYDGQRFSPLARINKGNVKGLRLAYAVPLGGLGGNEWNEATPLVENGFLYITDSWGVLYKIDGTSGDVGRIVWRVDPQQEKQGTNRGAALWGNLVISPANWPARLIATDKETGKVVWETNMVFGQAETRITAAPLALKDKIIVGASGGDSGVRDWIAGLDAATGRVLWRKFTIPAPREPGSATWKSANNAWQTGGRAVWGTGTYDPDTNQTVWGTGNPVPMFDPFHRPGNHLSTNSAISWDPPSGRMNWYFQYTP